MYRGKFLLAIMLAATGCTDTTAVRNFADESKVLSADTNIINGGDLAYKALGVYRDSVTVTSDPNYQSLIQLGPGSASYDSEKQLAPKAAAVLAQYMQAIAQLAGETDVVQTSDVSSISASLKTFGASSPRIQPALDATAKLANLVAQGIANKALTHVVVSSNQYVQTLTAFLAAFAERNSAVYDAARSVSGQYWADLTANCPEARLAGKHVLGSCSAIVALASRVHSTDEISLKKQVDAADAARKAFLKIGDDHQALADSASQFDSKALIATLKADEPVILAAIKDLEKL